MDFHQKMLLRLIWSADGDSFIQPQTPCKAVAISL